MKRRWTPALALSVVAHLAAYAGPWSLSRTIDAEPPPVVVQIELPPPDAPPPPPADDEPPPPPPEEPPPEPESPPPPRRSTPPPPAPPPSPPPAPAPDPAPTAPTPPVEPPPPTTPPPPPRPAPPTTPTPPPAPVRPGMSKADFVGYATGMRRRLLAHRRYPPAALRNGLEGVVKVKIGVDRRGRLVGEPTVAHSCGHPVLDDEALRMVRAASPFAPLPERADKEVVVFVIPLAFEIQVDG